MDDQRFAHVESDPKFRRIPKSERKVKIDKRFKSMFKDKQFKVKYTVDKRGRPVNHTSTENLKRYYELDSDASSIESDSEVGHNELDVKDRNDGNVSEKVKQKLQNLTIDYARGESTLFSESSSDDEQEDTDQEDDVEHAWGALDAEAERTEDVTSRLAACNMDWDRIRATDLMNLEKSVWKKMKPKVLWS
uniref:ESF1 RRM domain-containing protein n=1 Tax=Photinus pyralis TaxID=7054 RepID=A0A1Y1KKF1_PHOPY